MQLDAIKALIHEALLEVELLLNQQFDSKASLIKEVATHLIHAGGKRIRPTLVLLVAYAYNPVRATHRPSPVGMSTKNLSHDEQLPPPYNSDVSLAVAIELIHAATLLHDDVVDNSTMRRSESTANAVWDNAASVLVGDFLYSRAFQLIVSVEEISVLKMLAETTNIIATGEVLQLQNRNNPDITEENYLDVLRYKTGALFSAATQAGAISALRPTQEVANMAQFGTCLGVAFQLIDDLLDYTADETILGKQLGDDLAEGKVTLPLLHALRHASVSDRKLITQSIIEGRREELTHLIAIVKKTGSLDYTQTLANTYAKQARDCLILVPESPYKQALSALTYLLVDRLY